MSSNVRETYVTDFQVAMGQDVDAPMSIDLLQLRMDLIKEEVKELDIEVGAICYQMSKSKEPKPEQLENMMKELVDVMYVVSGFAVTFGIPVQPAFVRVHQSNMTKLVDGKAMLREDGKVIKGPNYIKPNMRGLL